MIVGEHRKEMRAVARDPFVHGAPKGRLRPGADAALRIGRDVGRIERAEWGCEREAAGELPPTLGRVTLRAITAAREYFAPSDQFRGETSCCGWRDRSYSRTPCQDPKPREAETSECDTNNEQLPEHGALRDPPWIAMDRLMGITPRKFDRVNEECKRIANRCKA